MSATPGPWVYAVYRPEGGETARITTVAHCCDFVIGIPSDYPGGDYRHGDPSGDPEDDARLIAAAPRLLAALKRLIAAHDAHDTMHAEDGDDVARMIEWAAAEDEARAAIAAAEGKP